MLIRERVAKDVSACADLVVRIRALDGYPPWLGGDVTDFVAPGHELGAWIAETAAGEIAGHVALHPSGNAATISAASLATGFEPDRLAVVARLFVAPEARRNGVARTLLSTAVTGAHQRGLRPILDTDPRLEAAVMLYEATGWTLAGEVEIALPDGTWLPALVYLGPEAG